jgi:hypothetical protein
MKKEIEDNQKKDYFGIIGIVLGIIGIICWVGLLFIECMGISLFLVILLVAGLAGIQISRWGTNKTRRIIGIFINALLIFMALLTIVLSSVYNFNLVDIKEIPQCLNVKLNIHWYDKNTSMLYLSKSWDNEEKVIDYLQGCRLLPYEKTVRLRLSEIIIYQNIEIIKRENITEENQDAFIIKLKNISVGDSLQASAVINDARICGPSDEFIVR